MLVFTLCYYMHIYNLKNTLFYALLYTFFLPHVFTYVHTFIPCLMPFLA